MYECRNTTQNKNILPLTFALMATQLKMLKIKITWYQH